MHTGTCITTSDIPQGQKGSGSGADVGGNSNSPSGRHTHDPGFSLPHNPATPLTAHPKETVEKYKVEGSKMFAVCRDRGAQKWVPITKGINKM